MKAAKDAEEIGTCKELYNFLYEACNILRGPVSQDASVALQRTLL